MRALCREAWRNVRARRTVALVAWAGLTLALAACLLWGLLALVLAQPDPAIPDPERVVLLDFKGNVPGMPTPWLTAGPVAFGPMLRARSLPLEKISRTAIGGIDFAIDGRIEPAMLVMADTEAVSLLGWRAVAGDLAATLGRHDGVAVSESLVRRLWGNLPPREAVGRQLTSKGLAFTVGAVVPDADPRGLFADANPMVGRALAMVGFDTQGNRWPQEVRDAIFMGNGQVFARLAPGARAEQVGAWMHEAFVASPLYAKLPAPWRAGGREPAFFRGLPVSRLPFEGEAHEARWRLLAAMGAACALLLLMAALNAMNLQAAVLLQRQRETALRRSLGADGPRLLALWAVEFGGQLLAAGAVAMLLAWWLAPAVERWIGLPAGQAIADPVPAQAWAGLGATLALLMPLVMFAPAWLALRRAPAPALQGRIASEGPWGRRVRQALLGVQVTGALTLLALTGVLALQQRHLLQAERGFDVRGRVWLGMMVDPNHVPDLTALARAFDQAPAISHWAFSDGRPAVDTDGQNERYASADRHEQVVRVTPVSPSYFVTWGMRLLAGAPRLGPPGEPAVVLDAKAARALGFATPQAAVGALLHGGGGFLRVGTEPRRVVAVVADVKLESARQAASPQAFVLTDRPLWDIGLVGADLPALRQAVEDAWRAQGPRLPHQVETAERLLAQAYGEESRLTEGVLCIALLAVGVAMLGAYALIADALRRRRGELVLRRLHGAGDVDIVAAMLGELAAPIGVALVVGLPLAAFLGLRYLGGFVDRVDAVPGVAIPLAVAVGITGAMTLAASARHAWLARRLRPVEALA
jgi:hypothetical protein